ncbi:MAG: hypothetical protein LIO86_09360 [Lachnospiraceae bacterium]|nr:hypothetical protein [Lachnospiraceae bacterium]
MKVKVIKAFKDKHTKEIHRAGDEFTCSKERYDEILSKDKYVEPVPPKSSRKKGNAESSPEE